MLAALGPLLAAAALAGPAAAQPQQPTPASPVVIDGPNAAIATPSGLGVSVARDGTGGLVYLKQVAGVTHVFVSVLSAGVWQAPVQVDSGLSGSSSQPVIAAANDGLLLVGFINGGELYAADQASTNSGFSAPVGLAGGASDPAISITYFPKAYMAFTVTDGSGDDVRAAYYDNGNWAVENAPLNVTPADDAGTGTGAPAVAAAGDGVAVVAWGEGGHVFTRRVWGTSPSVVNEQADAPLPGCTEASADHPVVGSEGDSSYAVVAFRAVVSCGGVQQSRVLMNRLVASQYTGIRQPDGLTGAAGDGADDPQLAMGDYGGGWVTSDRIDGDNVIATALGGNGVPEGTTQVNSLTNAAQPVVVPAMAGLTSTVIAWQQNPGSAALPEMRVRYAENGFTLGPEMVVSTPADGPVEAAGGLAADGDNNGDAVVAWLQDDGGAPAVVAAQLYQPPGQFSVVPPRAYSRSLQPVLAWRVARDPWGPIVYAVSLDGAQIGQTESTSLRAPSPLTNGPHALAVTATNPAGEQSASHPGTVFVDTVPPLASITVRGVDVIGSRLQASITYADVPTPGLPTTDASGVAKVVLQWSRRTVTKVRLGQRRFTNVFTRAGLYRVTLVVTDKAGNVTRATVRLRITKTRPKTKHKPGTTPPSGTKPPTKARRR